MCETSNRPAAVRTASCSLTTDLYWRGIPQPAKSTMRAPNLGGGSYGGVCRGISVVSWSAGDRADYNGGLEAIKRFGHNEDLAHMKIRNRLNPSNPCFS